MRLLRVVTAASGAVACLSPTYRGWAVASFGLGLLFEMGLRDTAKARTTGTQIAHNPKFVYWAQPGAISCFPFNWERIVLHTRDGNDLNLVLGPSRMRSVVRWMCERNSSILLSDTYAVGVADMGHQNGACAVQDGGASIERSKEALEMNLVSAAMRAEEVGILHLKRIHDILLRPYARRFQTWRALKNAFVIATVVLWFIPGCANWIPAAFAAGAFCQVRWMQIGQSGQAALRAIADATLVYWVQYPAELPAFRWWRRDVECAYVRLRDGEKVEVYLRRDDVRAVAMWFAERNPSAPIAPAFSPSLTERIHDAGQRS